jgi:hypothetical protein
VELINALISSGQAENAREAKEMINEVRQMLKEGEYIDPEEALHYEFGLEPDYVFDLMGC